MRGNSRPDTKDRKMSALQMLCALIAAHALCDYPLQGDFLAKAKNRFEPVAGVPWFQAMGAHVAIHGGAVGLITGVWWLGIAEAVAHFAIDDWKCSRSISFNGDQALHLLCKAAWVAIALAVTK